MTLILDLPDSKEAALKAKAKAQGVSTEQYVNRMLDRDLEEHDKTSPMDETPIWESITDLMTCVPDEVFENLPKDGASQIDHYIYGFPKRDE